MLLMIDNYDSFTYNLVQYFGELGQDVRVFRNDEIDLAGIAAAKPDWLVLSPGPCSPAEAGICVDAIREFTGKLPILGVCLGHQSIGAALGGKVIRAKAQMHGKTDVIHHVGRGDLSHLLAMLDEVAPGSGNRLVFGQVPCQATDRGHLPRLFILKLVQDLLKFTCCHRLVLQPFEFFVNRCFNFFYRMRFSRRP